MTNAQEHYNVGLLIKNIEWLDMAKEFAAELLSSAIQIVGIPFNRGMAYIHWISGGKAIQVLFKHRDRTSDCRAILYYNANRLELEPPDDCQELLEFLRTLQEKPASLVAGLIQCYLLFGRALIQVISDEEVKKKLNSDIKQVTNKFVSLTGREPIIDLESVRKLVRVFEKLEKASEELREALARLPHVLGKNTTLRIGSLTVSVTVDVYGEHGYLVCHFIDNRSLLLTIAYRSRPPWMWTGNIRLYIWNDVSPDDLEKAVEIFYKLVKSPEKYLSGH